MQDERLFELYQKIMKEHDPHKFTELVGELLKTFRTAESSASQDSKAMKKTAAF